MNINSVYNKNYGFTHHQLHHRYYNKNFGVLTSGWDKIFNTKVEYNDYKLDNDCILLEFIPLGIFILFF